MILTRHMHMAREGPPHVAFSWELQSAMADGLWTNLLWICVPKDKHCQMAVTSVSLSCQPPNLYSISYFIFSFWKLCIGIRLLYYCILGNTKEVINIVRCWFFLLKVFLLRLGFSLCHISTLSVRTQGDLSKLNYLNKIHRTIMPKMPLVHSTTFADLWSNLT